MRESAENYLETIILLEKNLEKIRSIDIAHATGFSKPSISVAMKKLQQEKLIEVSMHGEIILTDLGRKHANDILERHKTLMKMFTMFGVEKAIAEEDACKVEHILHKETFAKIKEFMHNYEKT